MHNLSRPLGAAFLLVASISLFLFSMTAQASPVTLRYSGVEAEAPGSHRWIIAIKSGWRDTFCSGALIDKGWALTAAHCLNEFKEKDCLKIKLANDPSGKEYSVAKYAIHPDENFLTHDIALLKLDSEVELDEFPLLNDIRASLYQLAVNRTLIAAGYGHDEKNLYAPIVHPRYRSTYVSSTYSFWYREGEIEKGDSGGPLFLQTPENIKLIGICTHGSNVTRTGRCQPLVENLDFIFHHMKQNSSLEISSNIESQEMESTHCYIPTIISVPVVAGVAILTTLSGIAIAVAYKNRSEIKYYAFMAWDFLSIFLCCISTGDYF